MSEPSATERDRIERLADSFMISFRAGERPSIDVYVEQYPELANELRGLIAALIVLEQNAPRRIRPDRLSQQTPPRADAPLEIGEFTIVREIGRGGMGVVYEAVQQSLGRHVALKVLSTPGLLNPTHLERFRLEARSAGRLHHSHIVPVFGVGEHEGTHYYAMQFIPGQSLDQVIDALARLRGDKQPHRAAVVVDDDLTDSLVQEMTSGRFGTECQDAPERIPAGECSPATNEAASHSNLAATGRFSSGSGGRSFYESVARVGLQVAEALAYAHAEGILHRDIKPSNLLLDGKGDTWVTDFGLVKADETQSLTATGDFVGTLRYMAPERLDGWSDRRSDIYGLGATLYELLTLRTLFGDVSRGQLVDCIRNKQPEPPTKIDPSAPRDLETVILKALSKEPGSRYHSAEEIAEDLRRFLADRPILARRATAGERLVRWCRRNPAVASLTATVAVALLVGTIASTWQAIRATRAEELAEQRFETERAARQETQAAHAAADKARVAEVEQRQLAEAKHAEAEASYQEAKAAVDKYFTLVSESRLLDVPGLKQLRRDLLESAVQFYDVASQKRAADPSVLSARAAAQLRVGLIYAMMDQIDDCMSAFQSALKIVDEVRRHPEGAAHLPEIAGFWSGYRWRRGTTRAPRDAIAAAVTLYRLESTWVKLAAEFPSEPAFQRDLVGIQGAIASAQSSVPYAKKMFATADKLVKDYPQVLGYREDLSLACTLLARFQGEQSEETHALMRKSIELAEGMVAEKPDSPASRSALANALGTFGAGARWALPEPAESALRRAVQLYDALLREFPDDVALHEYFAVSVAEWVWCPSADINGPEARQWIRQAMAELEILAHRRPEDRYPRQMLAVLCHNVADRALHRDNQLAVPKETQERALDLFTRLAHDFPDSHMHTFYVEHVGWSNRNLGTIAERTNRLDEAALYAEAASAAFAELAANAGIPQRDGFYKSREAEHLAQQAQVLVAAGKPGDAEHSCLKSVQLYEALLAEYPQHAEYRSKALLAGRFLSQWALAAGRPHDAVEPLRRQLALFEKLQAESSQEQLQSTTGCACLNLAVPLMECGQAEEAKDLCKKGVGLLAGDVATLNYFAWPLAASRDVKPAVAELAVQAAEQATQASPGNLSLWNTLGVAQYRAGQWEPAIVSLIKAEGPGPENPLAVLHQNKHMAFDGFFLAMTHWRLDRKDEARTWFDRSVEWMQKNQPKNEELMRFRAEAEQLLGLVDGAAPKP